MAGMHPRTVALVVALSLATGWALGGRYAGQAPGAGTGVPSRGPRPLGVETPRATTPLTEQLRRKLDRQPVAPQPSRNPFVFGGRPAAPGARAARGGVAVAPEPAVPVDAAPTRPALPVFTLAGIAASKTTGGGGVEYTAILSGTYGLVFAHAGDTLPGGFAVVDVRETMVTLRDGLGEARTLHLP